MKLIAAVEGGGTSFKVAVCKLDGTIVARTAVDSTGDPATTLTRCAIFLMKHNKQISALGIACFGPVGVKPDDEATYGRILNSSPKRIWRNVDFLTPLKEACGDTCPVMIDTDVNAPAVSEFAEHSARISSCAYITVGTGVGVGLVVNGTAVHGRMHPEGGHVPVQPLRGDTFGGYSWGRGEDSKCPFGGINTVEGLASSVALTERYELMLHQVGVASQKLDRDVLKDLTDDSEIWDHAANALACLCTTLLLTLSIEKIVLGGGVMRRAILLDKIRTRTAELLNGYLDLGYHTDEEALKHIITLSKHGDDAGLVGAIALAQRAHHGSKQATDLELEMKRQAFLQGLWFGCLVGVVGTLAVVRFGFGGGRKSSHRR